MLHCEIVASRACGIIGFGTRVAFGVLHIFTKIDQLSVQLNDLALHVSFGFLHFSTYLLFSILVDSVPFFKQALQIEKFDAAGSVRVVS